MSNGGIRPGAGRPKGSRNKATLTLKQRFQKHERYLVAQVLKLARSTDQNIRLRAVTLAIERGWGKAPQPLTGEEGQGPALVEIRRVIVDAPAVEPGEQPEDTPSVVH